MKLLPLLSILITLIASSCGTERIKMPNVNLEAFKADRGGCKEIRTEEIDNLKTEKDSLLGKSENAIIEYLGRYDKQMLDERNTKIFIYYLEKGDQCNNPAIVSDVKTMAVWFNATKLVREITFQQGLP